MAKGKQFLSVFPPPLFPYIALVSMFTSPMALLGFVYNSSLFASPVTSPTCWSNDNGHWERECTHWGEKDREEEEEKAKRRNHFTAAGIQTHGLSFQEPSALATRLRRPAII